MNPFELFEDTKKLKTNLDKIKKELDNKTVVGTSGGDMVKIELTASFDMISIFIDPIAVDNRDVPMLQDLIKAAYTDGVKKIKDLTSDSMKTAFSSCLPEELSCFFK